MVKAMPGSGQRTQIYNTIPDWRILCRYRLPQPDAGCEVDGWSHDVRQGYDARRDEYMQSIGYRVLRFTNEDVMNNLEGVVITIAQALPLTPSPGPSRKREGS